MDADVRGIGAGGLGRGPADELFCPSCDKTYSSAQALKDHMNTQKHKKAHTEMERLRQVMGRQRQGNEMRGRGDMSNQRGPVLQMMATA